MFGSRAFTASSVRFGVALGRLERTGDRRFLIPDRS
jgi:hypothetical protein